MFRPVVGMVILDSDGNRLIAKYFGPSSNEAAHIGNSPHASLTNFAAQIKFEEEIFQKSSGFSQKSDSTLNANLFTVEIVVLQDCIALCKVSNDVYIYVIGENDENELILQELCNTLFQGLINLTNNNVNRKHIMENLDSVYILFDELVDDGIILELDPVVITQRVHMQSTDIPEQTAINQAISSAKENIIRNFLSGGG